MTVVQIQTRVWLVCHQCTMATTTPHDYITCRGCGGQMMLEREQVGIYGPLLSSSLDDAEGSF